MTSPAVYAVSAASRKTTPTTAAAVCATRIVQGESWQGVAVILAAIDRSLGIDLNVAIRNIKKDGSTKVAQWFLRIRG